MIRQNSESTASHLGRAYGSLPDLVANGFLFLEGPRRRRGITYASDMHGGRVVTISDDGAVEVLFEFDGKPSGLGFDQNGSLLVVEMISRRILRWDGSRLDLHADLSAIAPFPLNDLLVDASGRCYVGSLGFDPWKGSRLTGEMPDTAKQHDDLTPAPIFQVQPNGKASVAAQNLMFPNGLALSPDGRRLYVAETYGHRISVFCIGAHGDLSNRQDFSVFHPSPSRTVASALASRNVMPDGIAMSPDGSLWVADANGSGALRLDASGQIIDHVEVSGLAIYAVALGEDGETLYVCAAPSLPDRAHRPLKSGALYRYSPTRTSG